MDDLVIKADVTEANAIREEWGTLFWLASEEIGNVQGLTLGRTYLPPGKSNPRHSHPNCDEVLYVLQGTLRNVIGGETVVLEAGDTITVARGTPHQATNIGQKMCDVIVAYNCGRRIFKLEI
jgi:quercetin dioxygenase-like cupin family protein